MSHKTDI